MSYLTAFHSTAKREHLDVASAAAFSENPPSFFCSSISLGVGVGGVCVAWQE